MDEPHNDDPDIATDDESAEQFAALDSGAIAGASVTPDDASKAMKGEKPKGGKGGAQLHAIEGGRKGGAAIKAKPVEAREHQLERGDHHELASKLIDDLTQEKCGGQVVFADADLRQYNHESGVFGLVSEERQFALLDRYAGLYVERDKKSLMMQKSTAQGAIWWACKKVLRPRFFMDAPKGIAFSNVFVKVDIAEISTTMHSPDNRARHGYSFPYDPNAKAPRFFQFLDEIFHNDYDKAQKIALLQEFAGAAICGLATLFCKLIVGLGVGANGKSTWGEILVGIMPEDSVCYVAPHDWKDDYSLAELRGKLLNYSDELPVQDLTDTDRVKAVVDGRPLKARAIFKDPVFFRPGAAHYFATNTLPGVSDQSHGFWRRMLPIEFNMQFNGKDADRTLAQRILAEEKPGIIAWALEGAARLLLNNNYTIPPSCEKLCKKWRSEADSVALFIHENYTPVERTTDGTSAKPLYQEYRSWSKDNGFVPTGIKVFSERMAHMGHARKRIGKGSVYGVRAYGPTEGPPHDDADDAPASERY